MRLYYTDGSASTKTKAGGWAVVCVQNNHELMRRFSSEKDTTNNRMELKAVIFALKNAPSDEECIVYTDSAYIANCIKQKWYEAWENRGWYTSKKTPVLNQDLWEKLVYYYREKNIKIEKVPGHQGYKWNEMADSLAVYARTKLESELNATEHNRAVSDR